MAASKVLGEETIAGSAQQQQQQGQGQTKGHGNRASERKDDSDSDFWTYVLATNSLGDRRHVDSGMRAKHWNLHAQ